MDDHFVIRGVITDAEQKRIGTAGARSNSFPRLDIDEFSAPGKHGIKWNLYLRALASIQRDDTKDDLLSYYQLAGIHGLPLQTWPVQGGPPAVEWGNIYCTHSTNRFLPWHRVYLLLVEQVIVLRALKLAGEYDESVREEYKTHATQIRLPYWDWAKDGGTALPKAVTNPKVFVTPPTGIPVEIDNPMYSYKFRAGERLITGKDRVIVQDGTETDRKPALDSPREMIFHVLNENRGFNYVATNGISKGNSIEGVHNDIHGEIGGRFMPNALISAYDPIFWLHHSNIDRCYALWQAMNPNAHYRSGKSDMGAADPQSERHLAPFYYSTDGQEWKLNMIQKLDSDSINRTTFDYGYHYPDITLGNTKRATELEVRLRVMRLYGPKPKNADAIYPEGAIKLAEIMHREGTIKLSDLIPGVRLPDNVALRHEWIVYYKIKKFIVEDNFTLFFFFGEPGDEPALWSTSQQLVGSMHSFKSPADTCVNCATDKEAGLVLSGEIDLTNALLRHANEVHLGNPALGAAVAAWLNNTAGVESWLKQMLTWRIMKEDGTAHKPVEGLVVGVKSCMTSYPPYSDLDGFDGYEMKDVLARTFGWSHHHAITEQKEEIGGVTVPVAVS